MLVFNHITFMCVVRLTLEDQMFFRAGMVLCDSPPKFSNLLEAIEWLDSVPYEPQMQ